MPVQSPHVEYLGAITKWQRCRHVLAGEDAVKEAGECYLPRLEGQEQPDYAAYKMRAVFFNATGRTVDTFVGMVFRVNPKVDAPEPLSSLLEDANLQGQSLVDYIKFVVREVIGLGRSGTLVDWCEEENRAYVCNYTAEQILNWRTARIAGKVVLSMVVLHEMVNADEALRLATTGKASDQSKAAGKPMDPEAGVVDHHSYTGPAPTQAAGTDDYVPTLVEQIRVLRLVTTDSKNFFHVVEIWQKPPDSKKDDYQLVATITPQRKGKPLGSIPFVFHGPNNQLAGVDKSPIDDICSLNLSHYRTSADLEHGRHFTGLPTPFIAGVDTTKPIRIGSQTCITASEPNAKATYLEFTGTGLSTLKEALEEKEHQMSVLGARMLEAPKKATETVDAIQMKQTGEQSSLAQIAMTAGESFEMVLRWALFWNAPADSVFTDSREKVSVELNTDFNPMGMDPALILAIVQAVHAGLLSDDSAVTAFKRGELVSPLRNPEEELALIETRFPKLLGNPLNTEPKQKAA